MQKILILLRRYSNNYSMTSGSLNDYRDKDHRDK